MHWHHHGLNMALIYLDEAKLGYQVTKVWQTLIEVALVFAILIRHIVVWLDNLKVQPHTWAVWVVSWMMLT